MRTIAIFMFTPFLLAIFSCKSSRRILRENNIMYSMIYDYDNMPMPDVEVTIDGRKSGKSDIHGRYMFLNLSWGEHEILLEKSGYESISAVVVFDPSQAIYFKIGNAEQYMKMAVEALDNGDNDNAIEFCKKAIEIDSTRHDILYLSAVIHNKRNEFEESEAALGSIIVTEENKTYIEGLLEKNRLDREAKNFEIE